MNYDVIIIGAGPAGLTAAIYALRANLSVLVIEKEVNGGKLSKTYEIENYPGLNKISGLKLAEDMSNHAIELGAKIISNDVNKIDYENKIVYLKDDSKYQTKAIIIATGTKERMLDLPRAQEFVGRGISYCAVCDGFFYRNKEVIIIGGGNSALQEALYLSSLAKKVSIIIRRDKFRADENIVSKVLEKENIEVINKSIPESLAIENNVIIGLNVKNVKTNEIKQVSARGIFPYIGADPATSFLDLDLLDDNGYLIVNKDMETKYQGIYGAGDCINKTLRQIVTACNDGAIAATSAIKMIKEG